MSPKQLALRWFDEVWNRKNVKSIHELMEPSAAAYTEGGAVVGPERFEQEMYQPLSRAFPDLTVTVDGVIEEGEEVAVRWTAQGTNTGDFPGVPATGRAVRFSGMTWLRVKDGKLVEGWDRWNVQGLITLLSQGVPCATSSWVD